MPPWAAGGCLLALLACACTQIPDDPLEPARAAAVEYTVLLPSMPLDSVHVRVTVQSWPDSVVTFLLPPAYADNPLPRARVVPIRNIRVRAGADTTFVVDTAATGLFRTARIAFRSAAFPAELEYDVFMEYEPRWGLPLPGVAAAAGYLQGTYLFAVPVGAGEPSLAAWWRRSWDMRVTFDVGEGVAFHGNPVPHSYPRTAYELLFATVAMGGEEISSGSAAGQPFRFVNLRDTVYDPAMKARLASRFAALTGDIVPLFGTLDWPLTVILGVNTGGGLEGTYAFSVIAPSWADSGGVFDMVCAHELLHCWIGVRTGELDMAWWKEATTNYLGYLVSARQGQTSDGLLSWAMTVDLTDSADVRDYPLSSSRVREFLYDSAQGMANLVYTKGAQVCMLMDLRIRTASAGRQALDTLVARFCRTWDGRAFTRDDYMAYLESNSGADLDAFFAQYVDAPGAVPQPVLVSAFDSLRTMGAFGARIVGKIAAAPAHGLARW